LEVINIKPIRVDFRRDNAILTVKTPAEFTVNHPQHRWGQEIKAKANPERVE